jgi:DNA adenine methylase
MALAVPISGRAPSPVRWAGGKRWLLPTIRTLVLGHEISIYHEPFLGGASVFLGLDGLERAFLGDTNAELIAAYRAIRDHPAQVADRVSRYPNNADMYYAVRACTPTDKVEIAARFLYLNHTSFNGIYRVNLEGVYNVPFGSRASPQIPTAEHLREVSRRLRKARLYVGDFARSLERVQEGHLVFLDPPYTVAHNNNGFIKYNQKIFSIEDQERLSALIDEISSRGAYYILANAAHPSIAKLFRRHGAVRMDTSRRNVIGGVNAIRGSATEFLFTNLKAPRR